MTRKLVKTGNSSALILTKDMREHLGIDDVVEVQIKEGEIVLKRPMSFEEAAKKTHERFPKTYERLSK